MNFTQLVLITEQAFPDVVEAHGVRSERFFPPEDHLLQFVTLRRFVRRVFVRLPEPLQRPDQQGHGAGAELPHLRLPAVHHGCHG